MARAAILEKYASALEQADRDRIGILLGHLDPVDVAARRARTTRIAIGLYGVLFKRRRPDACTLAAILADLRDDGVPDWTYWLDNRSRRYRLRPWRTEDGPPWSYRTPCVTVLDGETGKSLNGIPAGALKILGLDTKLEDTDACCAALIEASRRKKKVAE